MVGPLDGLLVLDLGFVGVGPIACSWMAMLGARVIKVESPAGDPAARVNPPALGGRSVAYMAYNLRKDQITLDLNDGVDRNIFDNMVARADVVAINWRLGQAGRLGIGYEQLRRRNKRLIYISCLDYGHRGPYKGLPSFDPWGANLAGLTGLNGQPGAEGELDRGPLACDLTTSATVLQGALIALYCWSRTGKGQTVETSQLQAAMSLVQTWVEPSEGDYARDWVFDEDEPSAVFETLNRNKGTIRLGPYADRDRQTLRMLALQADVVMADTGAAVQSSVGLDYEEVADENPEVIYIELRPFPEDASGM